MTYVAISENVSVRDKPAWYIIVPKFGGSSYSKCLKYMKEFGTKLRVLRQKHGLTLKELATRLGYETHSYLSEIESAKKRPTADLVLKVSRLFEVSTDSLLKDEISIEDIEDETIE